MIAGVPFVIAIVLGWIAPLSFPRGVWTLALVAAGLVLILAGVTLIVRARREFAHYGQPTDPGLPTSQVITTGVFSISRNPLYLGGVVTLAGIALSFNLPWGLIALLPALLACHYILIVPEEKYLAVRFGEEYRDYAASVGRWFGRSRRSS